MSTIKTLLVDDEYLALNLLETFIQDVPGLEVVAKVKSAMAALEVLNSQPIDLLFLDIQMPTLSGVNMLKTLQQQPVTIFTTAYSEYAIQAFDLNVVDYLVKPFPFERFLQAVNKAKEQLKLRQPIPTAPTSSADFLTAKVDGKIVKLFYDDILFVEGLKEYVRFICRNGKYVTLESLKNLEEQLPADRFLRVHKSYIISKEKVQSILGNMLEIQAHKIPISRGKREEVVQAVFNLTSPESSKADAESED
ncbi:MAG: LytTR family DNA-binding domain-containing protein [Saprospiraceae bacterium]|nr:LytTR family DNA-binding domain-containing protein [Saprospiraceae bacterium]MCF8251812.1 LytTR family DNA-binding domain-containing protein [Saprospiraceae bacterium]MCF8281466.1 LytTR family DNA-binding domain-containing protein [Bacteroidales bacterium]MCF8313526.1 LytTR family DNA-binding domain-containing protein [Saprospiraceae bacterium]MCF8442251.1 LytTR family DNA-binding domain-containing protein [Saprospiraceae bacterium]